MRIGGIGSFGLHNYRVSAVYGNPRSLQSVKRLARRLLMEIRLLLWKRLVSNLSGKRRKMCQSSLGRLIIRMSWSR